MNVAIFAIQDHVGPTCDDRIAQVQLEGSFNFPKSVKILRVLFDISVDKAPSARLELQVSRFACKRKEEIIVEHFPEFLPGRDGSTILIMLCDASERVMHGLAVT